MLTIWMSSIVKLKDFFVLNSSVLPKINSLIALKASFFLWDIVKMEFVHKISYVGSALDWRLCKYLIGSSALTRSFQLLIIESSENIKIGILANNPSSVRR